MLVLLVSLCLMGPALCQQAHAPLEVKVFYEALCPDSKHFMVEQVNTTYHAVSDIVSFAFIPYGKATTDADYSIACQHGWQECWGNRLHWCVADNAASEGDRVRAVTCLMAAMNSLSALGVPCAEEVGESWDDMVSCSVADQSLRAAVQFGKETAALSPALTSVPTVTVDGSQGSAREQRRMLTDLLGYVCDVWAGRTGARPAGCPHNSGA